MKTPIKYCCFYSHRIKQGYLWFKNSLFFKTLFTPQCHLGEKFSTAYDFITEKSNFIPSHVLPPKEITRFFSRSAFQLCNSTLTENQPPKPAPSERNKSYNTYLPAGILARVEARPGVLHTPFCNLPFDANGTRVQMQKLHALSYGGIL
ncbi:hypothetical protein CEXT_177291 [Caerostris extrusa]|uniref:Uncharacterized protein n=1 Tax=Caerostris extrusa TaxID=172846 RepID=A0AAV4MSE1_CAEEX|nr:hypothetical protein CEXT_177291 [Caerostris extrusa]